MSDTPRAVLLRPRSTAYFFAAKFRCETGRGEDASTMRVLLPKSVRPLRIALPPDGGGYGVSALTYCYGPPAAAIRAANTVLVSALTATF